MRTPEQKRKPLYDWSEDEILARLREVYSGGHYVHAPADYVRELQRRTEARHATVAIWTSIVSAITATVAVILSAYAIIAGA